MPAASRAGEPWGRRRSQGGQSACVDPSGRRRGRAGCLAPLRRGPGRHGASTLAELSGEPLGDPEAEPRASHPIPDPQMGAASAAH